jgi:hypothetical protein
MALLYVHPVSKLGHIIAPSGSIIHDRWQRVKWRLISSLGGTSNGNSSNSETSGGEWKRDPEGAESPLQLPATAGPPATPQVATHLAPRTDRPLGLSRPPTGHGRSGKCNFAFVLMLLSFTKLKTLQVPVSTETKYMFLSFNIH